MHLKHKLSDSSYLRALGPSESRFPIIRRDRYLRSSDFTIYLSLAVAISLLRRNSALFVFFDTYTYGTKFHQPSLNPLQHLRSKTRTSVSRILHHEQLILLPYTRCRSCRTALSDPQRCFPGRSGPLPGEHLPHLSAQPSAAHQGSLHLPSPSELLDPTTRRFSISTSRSICHPSFPPLICVYCRCIRTNANPVSQLLASTKCGINEQGRR